PHKRIRKAYFVRFELCLPVAYSDLHALADGLSVRQKFTEPYYRHRQRVRAVEGGRAYCIAVGTLVHPFDQITGFLEFNREIKRCRDINALCRDASLVRPTRSYLIGP